LGVRLADPLRQQSFFPAHDGVVFEREQSDCDGREPDKLSAERKAGPQEDVADVQRIANESERTARHQGTEAVASRSRDRADVVHRPEPYRLANRDDKRADDPQ